MIYVLEEIFKSSKNNNSERFNLRVQRSLSWLKKAVLMEHDKDLQFLSLRVSFNAIYAEDVERKNQQKDHISQFLALISRQDQTQHLSQMVWGKLFEPIQKVLANPYSYQAYWDYRNQVVSQVTWKESFEHEKKLIHDVFETKNLNEILSVVLNRMLTIEHQILQGGSSYNSSINRPLLSQCCEILIALIPAILELLINNAQKWHFLKPHYPVVQVS